MDNAWQDLDRWLASSPPIAVDDDDPPPDPPPDPEPDPDAGEAL